MKNRNRKGFTLMELLVVIGIIGILAALLIPNIIRYIRRAQKKVDLDTAKTLGEWVVTVLIDPEMSSRFYANGTATNNVGHNSTITETLTVHTKEGKTEHYKVMVVTRYNGIDIERKGNDSSQQKKYAKNYEYENAHKLEWHGGSGYKFYGAPSGNGGAKPFEDALNKAMAQDFTTNTDTPVFPMKYTDHEDGTITDRWYLCYNLENKRVEIWAGYSAEPGEGSRHPHYRVWPDPDVEYSG